MSSKEISVSSAEAIKIMLVLMVRNEAKIIARCVEAALPFVDAVLLADTGSADDTTEAAEKAVVQRPLKVARHEWRNFGENRSDSMRAAQAFAQELSWDPAMSYALALDADMVLKGHPEAVRSRLAFLGASGVTLKQVNGNLEYHNVRFMRLSEPWWCEGCTHEYWTGGGVTLELPGDAAWIEDLGDGGCKADKFERDKKLLLQGLAKRPKCERYMFYLAQTYHCLNEDELAVKWYTRRIEASGWFEEIWYSHLMIARTKLKLGDVFAAEHWVDKGLKLQPDRIEGVLSLVSHFRGTSQHFKAWHYLKIAEGMKRPSDARLFLESDAYGHKLDYERSILHYYVCPEDRAEGAMLCLKYDGPAEAAVMQNLTFYAEAAPALEWLQLRFPTPEGFSSSSIAINDKHLLCVRTVSYHITDNGSYLMKDGLVETRNFKAQWNAAGRTWTGWAELEVDAASCNRWRRPDSIRGLEDVRLHGDAFTATTREYSYCEANRIVYGRYPDMTFLPVAPPHGETYCEKNWLPMSNGSVVYQWHPFMLGRVIPPDSGPAVLKIDVVHETPKWFRHLRGSASPLELDDGLWVLTHIVSPRMPRHYFHVWIILAKDTFLPLMHSPPFFLRHHGIEYCIGTTKAADAERLGLFVSVWDRESWYCEVSLKDLRKSLKKI